MAALIIVLGVEVTCAAEEQPAGPDRLGELVFSDLYAHEFQKAGTDAEARVELAKWLMSCAQLWEGNREFVLLHYRRAYHLAKDYPAGYKVAVAAMRGQAQRFPETRTECLERIADVQRRMVRRSGFSQRQAQALMDTLLELADSAERNDNLARAGGLCREAMRLARRIDSEQVESLEQRVRDLTVLTNVARRREALEKRLDRDSGDTDARKRLVLLEVTERDDPSAAEELLNGELDEDLSRRVRLAAREPNELDRRQARELARWYSELSRKGSPIARRHARARAEGYEQLAAGGPVAAAFGRED
ncbi:MAG: hypothetical protein ACOC9S_00785 [Planctomycetota bacterium]